MSLFAWILRIYKSSNIFIIQFYKTSQLAFIRTYSKSQLKKSFKTLKMLHIYYLLYFIISTAVAENPRKTCSNLGLQLEGGIIELENRTKPLRYALDGILNVAVATLGIPLNSLGIFILCRRKNRPLFLSLMYVSIFNWFFGTSDNYLDQIPFDCNQ